MTYDSERFCFIVPLTTIPLPQIFLSVCIGIGCSVCSRMFLSGVFDAVVINSKSKNDKTFDMYANVSGVSLI